MTEETPRRIQMVMLGAITAEPGGQGCALHKVHNPSVTTLLVHQVFPVDLQVKARDADAVLDEVCAHGRHDCDDCPSKASDYDHETVFVCPTGKMNVDAYISYLLGEGDPLPVRVGPETKALASEGVRRYEAARHAAGRS